MSKIIDCEKENPKVVMIVDAKTSHEDITDDGQHSDEVLTGF